MFLLVVQHLFAEGSQDSSLYIQSPSFGDVCSQDFMVVGNQVVEDGYEAGVCVLHCSTTLFVVPWKSSRRPLKNGPL